MYLQNLSNTFESIVFKGLSGKTKSIGDNILDRINMELAVIKELNLTEYFLIFNRIIEICNKNKILISPSFSSSGDSLINYCLGITNINPLEYNLYFESFINKEIKSFADIDICISNGKLNLIIDELKRQLPDKKFSLYATKPFILSTKEQKIIYNNIEYEISSSGHIISNQDEKFDLEKLSINQMDCYIVNDVFTDIQKLAQCKFDILEFEVLEKLEKLIKKSEIIIHPYNIKFDDIEIYEFLLNDNLDGLFCFSQNDAKKMIPEFKPNNIVDLAIIDALAKPWLYVLFCKINSSKQNGIDSIFNNDERINKILKETYGFFVFQETYLEIMNVIAGFSLQKAEYYRFMLTKKDCYETVEFFKKEFKVACLENSNLNGVEVEILTQIIIENIRFSSSKSHYLGQSMIGYWCAYYKHYNRNLFDSVFIDT